MKAYPAYKPSGVAWLGDIPEGWQLVRLKQELEEIDERAGNNQLQLLGLSKSVGIVPRSELNQGAAESDNYGKYKEVRSGDLVMNKMQAWNGVFGVALQSGMVSPDYSVFRVNRPEYANFICTMLRTDIASGEMFTRCRGMGTAFLRLNSPDFLDMHVALPPKADIGAVNAFLDREVAKIDGLIQEQRRLIALLAEKRQATISHAVTKGLNPNAKLKPSGIDWLGDVPEGWDVVQLKHLCTLFRDGTHLPPPRVDDGIPLLSVRNIQNGVFSSRDDDSMISEKDYEILAKSFVPHAGDVLLAIVGATLGKSAIVSGVMPKFHIQRSLAIFRTKPVMRGEWLNFLFQSDGFQKLIWSKVGYSAQPGIYLGMLADVKVVVPSTVEQDLIIGRMNERLDELESLTVCAVKSVELLQERRSALISAAVTGKIDVRDLAPDMMEPA